MKYILIILSVLIFSAQIQAVPQRYDFVFTGNGNPTTAVGYIVLETDLIPNPTVNSDNFISLPDPLVLDINVTVSGSSSGDGTFTLADFGAIAFATGGATLDITTEFVGQVTPSGTWGTPDGNNGDFNLLGISQPLQTLQPTNYQSIASVQGGPIAGAPPVGVFFFSLGAAGGGGESMTLSSFHPFAPPTPVPALSNGIILLVLTLLILSLGIFTVKRH